MRYAAIDIGSNAVRLLIADIVEYDGLVTLKKLSLTRVPVRLGSSVFETGAISSTKAKRLAKTMKAFRYLYEVYEVKDAMVCATSAMREATNSEDVIKRVKDFANIDIRVIDGEDEANFIFSTFETQQVDLSKTYLYIDVGGGSTEISLLKNGERVAAKSFKIGTVRILKDKVAAGAWDEMKAWVKDVVKGEQEPIAIGTGGNINRMSKMMGMKFGDFMHIDALKITHKHLQSMSYKERISKLRMRPDRADVIVPAGQIYIQVLQHAGIHEMLVPKVGLSDGMVLSMYHRDYDFKA